MYDSRYQARCSGHPSPVCARPAETHTAHTQTPQQHSICASLMTARFFVLFGFLADGIKPLARELKRAPVELQQIPLVVSIPDCHYCGAGVRLTVAHHWRSLLCCRSLWKFSAKDFQGASASRVLPWPAGFAASNGAAFHVSCQMEDPVLFLTESDHWSVKVSVAFTDWHQQVSPIPGQGLSRNARD